MFWDKFITLCNKIGKKTNPVAAELKISSGSITKWKNGGVPSDPNLKKIADYFGVPVEYFKSDIRTDVLQSARSKRTSRNDHRESSRTPREILIKRGIKR